MSATAMNLTTVTPAPEMPPRPEFDTTTPINEQVTSFTMRDIPLWGEWLLYRLQMLYPHLGQLNYQGYLSQYIGNNWSIFIKTKYAIGMAVRVNDPFEQRPIVRNVFVFKHHPDQEEENKDVRLILSSYKNWGKSMGARRVEITGYFGDVTPSKRHDMLGRGGRIVSEIELK